MIIIKAKDNYIVAKGLGGKYYIKIKENDFEIGDIISVIGSKQNIVNSAIESEFSFAGYLNSLGVYKEIDIYKYQIVFRIPLRLRSFKDGILNNYNGLSNELISSLVFNQKDYQGELTGVFLELEILYLLSVSGVHLNFLIAFIKKVTRYFTSNEKVIDSIVFLFLFPLYILNVDKFIFYRLGLIKFLKIGNDKYFNKMFSHLEILCFSIVIFLFVDISLVFQPSFFLTYLISLSMSLARPILNRGGKVKKYITGYLIVFLLFLPYRIITSSSINLTGIIIQPILSLFMGIVFLFSLVGLFTFGGGATLINYLGKVLLNFIKILNFFEINITVASFNQFLLVFYYLSLLLLFSFVVIKHQPLIKISSMSLAILLLFQSVPIIESFEQSISFINIGQGDATLIRDGNKTVLIDTGGSIYKDVAKVSLIPFFKRNKIFNIDKVIITHDDYDHVGGLESLTANFNVKEVIRDDVFPISFGGIYMENLNKNHLNYQGENEKSLVISLNFIGKKWLFMGDASIVNENEIINNYPNLDVDILKVGHHGSNTSTSEEFLDHITPTTAIISAGYKNMYGHPHEDVVNRLKNRAIILRRTDEEGTIKYNNKYPKYLK